VSHSLERFTRFFGRTSVRVKRGIAGPLSWNLDLLALLYRTDKGRRGHGYTAFYARQLGRRRRSVKSVLEIGVGGDDDPVVGGASLRMWRSYFPRATVYGLDVFPKRLPPEPRIVVLQGDQSDPDLLASLVASYGPFDLVIDDGSHLGHHQRASFAGLFPAVRPGGLYVIEDLETAYWEDWEGGPPGTPGTGVDLAKGLLDDVNIGPRPVSSVHAYRDIVFIERAALPTSPRKPFPPKGLTAKETGR
jgi:hypothetical protein